MLEMGQVVLGAYAALAFTGLAIAWYYGGFLLKEWKENPNHPATQYLTAIVLTWGMVGIWYFSLTYIHLLTGNLPRPVLLLPESVRVLYLFGLVAAGAYHLAARFGAKRLWVRFWGWILGMAAFGSAFAVLSRY